MLCTSADMASKFQISLFDKNLKGLNWSNTVPLKNNDEGEFSLTLPKTDSLQMVEDFKIDGIQRMDMQKKAKEGKNIELEFGIS